MLRQEAPLEKEHGSSFLTRLFRRVDGCDVRFVFADKASNDAVVIDDLVHKTRERMHLYGWKEAVKGRVVLTPTGSSYKHNGVLIELVGLVTVHTESGEHKSEFLRQQRRFEADTLTQAAAFEYEFGGIKDCESYRGINACVSYTVHVTILRPVKNIYEHAEVWVTRVDDALTASQPDASAHHSYFRETVFGPQSTSMDVGVDDLLHIEFRYDKKVFHLGERVLGRVTFKVADLDIQNAEVGIVRKEYIGPGDPSDEFECETLQKYEIMDGTPIVGEVVPIRLYLGSVPRLTPTYANVRNCFRVLYFLNLMLVTGEGKRYFKQQEITLYRRELQDAPVGLREADAFD